jgi:hypothetical protein
VSTGDSIYGARAFLVRSGTGEVGFSFLRERGDFREPDGSTSDRTLASADLWAKIPALPAEISGRADYDLETEGFARKRIALRGRPTATVDLSLAYDGYNTGDLSHGATNAPFLTPLPSYRLNDDVDALSFTGSWQATPAFAAEWTLKGVHHSEGDVGDAGLATLGGRYGYNGGKDAAGAAASLCRGDRNEDRYQEYRVFATWSPGKARFTADAVADLYQEEVVPGSSQKESYVLTGTGSLDVTDNIRVGGDVRWTDGPSLSNDLALVARVSMGFGLPAGGSR